MSGREAAGQAQAAYPQPLALAEVVRLLLHVIPALLHKTCT
jgi:hypothetical protein